MASHLLPADPASPLVEPWGVITDARPLESMTTRDDGCPVFYSTEELNKRAAVREVATLGFLLSPRKSNV